MFDGLLRGLALFSGALLILRSRRPPAASAELDDVDEPSATDALVEQLRNMAPVLLHSWMQTQGAERLRQARSEARAAAYDWRQLALEARRVGSHDHAERCERHAAALEREHDLLREDEPEDEDEDAAPAAVS